MEDATAASEDPKRNKNARTSTDEHPRDSVSGIDETSEEECLMKNTAGEKTTKAEKHKENQDGLKQEKTVTKVSANHQRPSKTSRLKNYLKEMILDQELNLMPKYCFPA